MGIKNKTKTLFSITDTQTNSIWINVLNTVLGKYINSKSMFTHSIICAEWQPWHGLGNALKLRQKALAWTYPYGSLHLLYILQMGLLKLAIHQTNFPPNFQLVRPTKQCSTHLSNYLSDQPTCRLFYQTSQLQSNLRCHRSRWTESSYFCMF